jgi:hypothetical protein
MKKKNTFAEGRFTKVNQVQVDPHHIVLENKPVNAFTAYLENKPVKPLTVHGVSVVAIPKPKFDVIHKSPYNVYNPKGHQPGMPLVVKTPRFGAHGFGLLFSNAHDFKSPPEKKRVDTVEGGCILPNDAINQEKVSVFAKVGLDLLLSPSDKISFKPQISAGIDLRKNRQISELPSDTNKQLPPMLKPEDSVQPFGRKGTGNGPSWA